MKETQVDAEGNVRCPVCGATDFSDKRTGKAKLVGVATVGVGALAMPKRLKCRGCGTNLKRGGKPYTPKKGMPGCVDTSAADAAVRQERKQTRLARMEAKLAEQKTKVEAKVDPAPVAEVAAAAPLAPVAEEQPVFPDQELVSDAAPVAEIARARDAVAAALDSAVFRAQGGDESGALVALTEAATTLQNEIARLQPKLTDPGTVHAQPTQGVGRA